ncbi:MAG: V-type ATP synthase subunit K [Kiritimatiellae bacterium]|nr:V-type ATP synthase subunit K [Kiritimatiellia bacterium]
MDAETMVSLGKMGAAAVFGLSAAGSALGTGAAGPAAIGAWKKCFAQNKAAPFVLLAFVGAPMSQTIYGMILMNQMMAEVTKAGFTNWGAMLGVGIFGGLAIGASAWWQGVSGAGASDAMAETGKGFGNYLMVLGIIETIALFVLVFSGGLIKTVAAV